jgi:hypothetical protein
MCPALSTHAQAQFHLASSEYLQCSKNSPYIVTPRKEIKSSTIS